MPKVGDFWESYRTDEFIMVVGEKPSPGITKISGLSEGEFETIEQPDGGSPKVRKISSSKVKFESLTIERNMDGSPQDKVFRKWFKDTFDFDGEVAKGSTVRKNGQIVKLHNGKEVMVFAFYEAWIKSVKYTDLEAGTNNLFKQTIVLEHEGLERIQ